MVDTTEKKSSVSPTSPNDTSTTGTGGGETSVAASRAVLPLAQLGHQVGRRPVETPSTASRRARSSSAGTTDDQL